jgi:hypothetical protein
MRLWLATIACIAVQPLLLAARYVPAWFASPQPLNWYLIVLVFQFVMLVATAAVLFLGIPTFLVLRRFDVTGWTPMTMAGFMLGALPVALLSWPGRRPGYSSNEFRDGQYVSTYIDGVPTTYAWLDYGESVAYFGLHGLVGALVFYVVWRRLGGR